MGHVSALDPLTAGTEDCLVERGSSARQEKKMHRLIKNNFLTCMFCFPRPRNSTTENYFHAHIIAYLMKRQKANSQESITWSELGKQSIQAKKFNWASRSWVGLLLQDQPLKCWPRLASERGILIPHSRSFFHENPVSRTFLKCYFEYFFLSQPVSVPNFAQSRFSGSI